MSNNPEKRNATQRIEDLENVIQGLYPIIQNMGSDLSLVKDAIKLLGNKLDSVVQALNSGEAPSEEVISRNMMVNISENLKEKVTALVSQGFLTPAETVTAESFVVGKQVDDAGKVHDLRLQIRVQAMAANVQEKLVGAKVGDLISFEEGKLKYEVNEIYSIQEPQAPEAAPVSPPEAV